MDEIELRGETIQCKDCGASFYLTAEEAEWFDRRGLHKPRRCPVCRKQPRRKAGICDKTDFSDEDFARVMSNARDEIARWKR